MWVGHGGHGGLAGYSCLGVARAVARADLRVVPRLLGRSSAPSALRPSAWPSRVGVLFLASERRGSARPSPESGGPQAAAGEGKAGRGSFLVARCFTLSLSRWRAPLCFLPPPPPSPPPLSSLSPPPLSPPPPRPRPPPLPSEDAGACRSMGIHFVLLISRQGKVRLTKWYSAMPSKERARTVREVSAVVLARQQKQCNFLEYKDKKIIYKRCASRPPTTPMQQRASEQSDS